MTKQESFKKRIRARMQETGEKYNAARRALIEQAERRNDAADGGRTWVAEPDLSDEVIAEATGRGWDAWVDLIEADPIADEGHTAVAAWLQSAHDVDGWWAQATTVGWERITGRRLRHQMADGTFTANKSRTLDIDAEQLRALLLDPDGRDALFPAHDPELRSRPDAKALRIGLGEGVAVIATDPRDDGRTTVSVSHEKLPTATEVELWKEFWADWLEALAEDAVTGPRLGR